MQCPGLFKSAKLSDFVYSLPYLKQFYLGFGNLNLYESSSFASIRTSQHKVCKLRFEPLYVVTAVIFLEFSIAISFKIVRNLQVLSTCIDYRALLELTTIN